MPRLVPAILAVFLLPWLAACGKKPAAPETAGGDAEAKIKVPEMHCSSCVGTIRGGLRDLPGIAGSSFDLEQRVVTVRWDSKMTNRQAIESAIVKAGFKVETNSAATPAEPTTPEAAPQPATGQ